MTIEVKNTPEQGVNISVGNALQEIDIMNVQEQKIDITERDGSQNIEIENARGQEIDVKEDIKTIKVYENAPEYEGSYEVTPALAPQTLSTAEKVLMKDITVEKIPITKVSNVSGGYTVIIG